MELQVLLFHDNRVHTYFLSHYALLSQLLFNKCTLAICIKSVSIFNIVRVYPYRNSLLRLQLLRAVTVHFRSHLLLFEWGNFSSCCMYFGVVAQVHIKAHVSREQNCHKQDKHQWVPWWHHECQYFSTETQQNNDQQSKHLDWLRPWKTINAFVCDCWFPIIIRNVWIEYLSKYLTKNLFSSLYFLFSYFLIYIQDYFLHGLQIVVLWVMTGICSFIRLSQYIPQL